MYRYVAHTSSSTTERHDQTFPILIPARRKALNHPQSPGKQQKQQQECVQVERKNDIPTNGRLFQATNAGESANGSTITTTNEFAFSATASLKGCCVGRRCSYG